MLCLWRLVRWLHRMVESWPHLSGAITCTGEICRNGNRNHWLSRQWPHHHFLVKICVLSCFDCFVNMSYMLCCGSLGFPCKVRLALSGSHGVRPWRGEQSLNVLVCLKLQREDSRVCRKILNFYWYYKNQIYFVLVLRLVLGSVWLGRKLGRGSCSLRF